MVYAGTSGVPTRLPIGSNGKVLKVSGGIPSWQTESGGGGGSLTVQEADGTPSVGSVATLSFNQAVGFTVTDQGGDEARVSLSAVPYSALNLTGAILNADLAGSIADSKLSTISTAGKVNTSALTGTLADGLFPATLPALNGSALTALNASNLATGTVDAARLPDLSGTYQPLNTNLTTISGLTPTDDDILQRKAGAWTNRTISQYKTDLGLATIATSGSASDLGSGTVPLARLSGITTAELSATAGITNAQLAGSIDLTSKVTGTLPVANGGTGITAFGTGIATALGVNVGSAGAPVLFNGAGGTPSSLTLTNGTGLPPTTGIVGWPANSSGVLTNNGSGTLSWGASGGTTINASDTVIPYRSNSTTFTDSPLSVASSAVTMTRSAIGSTSSDGIVITNTTAAAAGAQQWSPALRFHGSGWKTNATAAAQDVDWKIVVRPIQGLAAPSSDLLFSYSTNGGAYTVGFGLSNAAGQASAFWLPGAQSLSATNYAMSSDGANNLRINSPQAGNNGIAFQLAATTRALLSVNSSVTSFQVGSADEIGFNSATNPTGAPDAKFSRVGAGSIRMGAVNAASPVNQTLSTQGSRGGTDSNVSGANLTIQSGLGTGNSTPSSLILQSPLIGSSGTTAQTATTGLTIINGTAKLTSYTVATLPSASVAGDGAMAFATDATATTAYTVVAGGGSNKVLVISDGTDWIIH